MTASDPAGAASFGTSVAISGNTALVGADGDNVSGVGTGAAYVFTRSGSTWTQQAKLTADFPSQLDRFGRSVAISGDTVLVGAYGDDDGGSSSGSAFVFTRSGSTWTTQGKLTASDAATDDRFGYSVAISGNSALVGSILNDDNAANTGSAYVFTRSGTTWTEQVKVYRHRRSGQRPVRRSCGHLR